MDYIIGTLFTLMKIDLKTNNRCFYRPSIIIKFIADTHKAAHSTYAEDLCPVHLV